MQKWIAALPAVVTLLVTAALPADAGGGGASGSFVARAVPFPVMEPDIYYPQKGSCLGGLDGIHKVSEPFDSPGPGSLSVLMEGLSGDWDLYVLGTGGRQLGRSDAAQLLDAAEGKERVTVALDGHQRVQMVVCNWLGEPEVTVHFSFVPKQTVARRKPRHHNTDSAPERSTHKVHATGGPVTPLWQWDPSELEIQAGDKVMWLNETGADHHVTPYGGPWKNVKTMYLPIGDEVAFVFRKPGEYLYRCDFAFAGVEHSLLVGDDCIGMCGRIVVKRQR